jgi:protease IV
MPDSTPPDPTPFDPTSPRNVPPRPAPAQVMQVPSRRSGGLAIFFVLLLLFFLFGSVLLNFLLFVVVGLSGIESAKGVRETRFSHSETAENKVVVISLEGTILTGEGFIKKQIDQAKEDENVKAVVLRVNSPGGTITGSDYILHQLRELRKEQEIPIVVSMGSLCASGGYYVSMAVGDTPDSLFAEPTTWTGSIGVVIPHFNVGELMTDWGIEDNSIASHRLKTMGSLTRPMTEEEKEIFQGLVDAGFTRFKDVIREGRPEFQKDPKALDSLATGQIFTAEQAEKNGLVDKIGFLEAAVERAVALTGLSEDEVRVVKYKPEPTFADVLFGAGTDIRTPSTEIKALLDSTIPRGYYLFSRLPVIVAAED